MRLHPPFCVPAWFVSFCSALILVVCFNFPLWRFIGTHDGIGYLPSATLGVIGGFYFLVISLFAVPKIHKIVIALLFVISSVITPLMLRYGVLIDANMIRNAAETDMQETADLITWANIVWLFLGGVLPSIVLLHLRISYTSRGWRAAAGYATPVFLALLLAVTAGWVSMRHLAPFYRNHREARHMVVPYNAIAASIKYARQQLSVHSGPRTFTPATVHKITWGPNDTARRVIVFVVGETARAQNFSLGGYARNTNPKLATRDIVYFENFTACGTSTAVSVPCMFSVLPRSKFSNDAFTRHDTLLQQVRAAGIKTVWIDNNSSCKGACRNDEVMNTKLLEQAHPGLCADGECLDAILVQGLKQALQDNPRDDLFIVLHQKGSHGPLYHKRFDQQHARFKPYCTQGDLNACTQQEIVNAYDNSLLYTDNILDQVIATLQQHGTDNTAMFYVSDHGESLGENGLYLHGAPYMIAPNEQTHVPAVLWLSQKYQDVSGISVTCMRERVSTALSHDHVFAGLLDLAGVASTAQMAAPSLLQGCLTPRNAQVVAPTLTDTPVLYP